jgi:addiction module RelE/StbE family toxin
VVKVTWTRLAEKDLDEIEVYISQDSPYYARRTVEKILSRVEMLRDFPLIGRIVPEFNNQNIRELIEGNYRIVYFLISKTEIIITRVHHGARLLK